MDGMAVEDMTFIYKVITSLKFMIKLPWTQESDNCSAINSAIHLSDRDNTRHVKVRLHYNQEMTDLGYMKSNTNYERHTIRIL